MGGGERSDVCFKAVVQVVVTRVVNEKADAPPSNHQLLSGFASTFCVAAAVFSVPDCACVRICVFVHAKSKE